MIRQRMRMIIALRRNALILLIRYLMMVLSGVQKEKYIFLVFSIHRIFWRMIVFSGNM